LGLRESVFLVLLQERRIHLIAILIYWLNSMNNNDSIVYQNVFNKYFFIDAYKPGKYLVKGFCHFGDSIRIHFKVNENADTTFFINPKLIKCVYLGCDQTDRIDIYYDYRDGKSDIKFD